MVNMVIVVPETVQTTEVVDVKETVSPEVEVAERVAGEFPKMIFAGSVNEIVCGGSV